MLILAPLPPTRLARAAFPTRAVAKRGGVWDFGPSQGIVIIIIIIIVIIVIITTMIIVIIIVIICYFVYKYKY